VQVTSAKKRRLTGEAHRHAQRNSTLATGEKRSWCTSYQLEGSELRAISILIVFRGMGSGSEGTERGWKERWGLYNHIAQETGLK